ncbi:MAG: hypothetical protein KIS96_14390 [Bauldia sp.]|nr:hypothetical protein [Bauldia sp.]
MAKAQTQVGTRALRAIFADAKRRADDHGDQPDPDPNIPRKDKDGNEVKAGQWLGAPHDRMPPDCPVQVVGWDETGVVYCTSSTGFLRKMETWDAASLAGLFAPRINTMMYLWPAWSKPKKISEEVTLPARVVRVENNNVMYCLKNEAARLPTFDPNKQHRGRGGWQDNQNRFIWHSGNYLWTVDTAGGRSVLEKSRPSFHDGFLYTRQASTVEPWQERISHTESPAQRIFADLRTWKWERPYLDPVLVLGWLGCAIMGGALRQRPVVFTTGGAGVGKSTLQELLIGALGPMVTSTVNTTAAGIYQRAKMDSLPFMVDELESKAGSSRETAVIELARVAYTGGDISRGGADHEASTFMARQAFFFSAINAPPMNTQDKTRMALLNLSRLDKANAIDRKPEFSDVDGRMLLRQVMDGWPDFYPRLYQNYWDALAPQQLDSRAINTFGTLLAAAELLVGPEALEDVGLPVTEINHLGQVVAAATALERLENLDNWHKCLDLLFQASIEAWREGMRPTVGQVAEKLRLGVNGDGWDAANARERLQLVNLGCVAAGKLGSGIGPCLAVPADGPVLKRVFADTEFYNGVWYTALKQAPKNIVLRDLGNAQKVKINGSTKHCLLVDLDAFEAFQRKGMD